MIETRRTVGGDRRRSLLAFFALLSQPAAVLAEEGSTPAAPPTEAAAEASGIRVGGRLFWVPSGDVDLLGDLWADLPLVRLRDGSIFFRLTNRLTMQKPDTHFTFLVRDLQYGMQLGWRGRPRWVGRRELSAFIGRRGRERVDSRGEAFVQQAGLGLAGSAWAIRVGPVLHEHEVRADLVLTAEARVPLVHGPRADLGFEASTDALLDAGEWRAETAAGPRLALPLGSGVAASVQLLYLRGRNPLGLEEDRWLLGFVYEKTGQPDAPPPAGRAPDIHGAIAAGGGEGRQTGRLYLRFRSRDIFRTTRIAFSLDGNVLTARDTTDLYYRYQLGLERPLEGRSLLAVDFYHRSNHRLAEPADGVTSINVLEAGIETTGWMRPAATKPRPRRGLDAAARVGYLVDGSFGTERRWHARGGLRWLLPLDAQRLYLKAEAEAGEVRNHSYAVGIALRPTLDLQAEYRSDDQYYSRDHTAVLLTASYGF